MLSIYNIYIGTYRRDQEIEELCIGIHFIKYLHCIKY